MKQEFQIHQEKRWRRLHNGLRRKEKEKMSYNFIADKIEVRRTVKEGDKPRYVVKAHALVPNKKDIYKYQKDKNGNIKSFKSMFTDNCIKNIKEQAKHKKLFVDSQHELALNTNIKSMLKGKISEDEYLRIDNLLKTKQLPIAKLNDIEITENGLDIETELNPMFREVDADHQRYFDAIWYNLENKYLNGVSINFVPTDVTEDDNGDQVINNVDIFGFSYVDQPALVDNSIYEVAIRSMVEEIKIRTGEKMEDEKAKLEAEKAKIAEERTKVEAEKAEMTKEKEDAKKNEVEKQQAEFKKQQEELQTKAEALKKAEEEKTKLQDELNSVKGKVKQQTPPAQNTEKQYDRTFYDDNLKSITSEHDKTIEMKRKGISPSIDKTMNGFSELVVLASKSDPTAGLDEDNARYAKDNRLLDRGKADVITPQLKGEQ